MPKNNLNTLTDDLTKALVGREKTIIQKRFGLQDEKAMTFNAIGKEFKVTRERIRQIQEESLDTIRKQKKPAIYVSFINNAKKILKSNGNVLENAAFIKALKETYGDDTKDSSINFLLSVDESFYFFSGNNFFKPFWCFANVSLDSIKKLAEEAESVLKKEQKPMTLKEIFAKIKKQTTTTKQLANVLHTYKRIGANPFGQYGLISWSIINPLNARDKAYFLMKYYLKKPVHFKALTNYIKEHEDIIINQTTNKKKKIVSVQTVHNELIKDDRFVLIGHGHYALAEWGYSKGVIKDIIANIFQASNNNALSEDELIAKVQEQRMAKENTIRFNLRNNKCFEKIANGKYQLKATLKNDQDINDLPVLSA